MIEPFRHSSWATARLLEFCRDLSPQLLDATARGTYGPVKDTLAHYVGWEAVLAGAIEGVAPAEPAQRFTSLDDLLERARWLSERWERLLATEPHPERLVELGGGGARQLVRAGTVLTQVLYHGNHHRSQVYTTLRTVDVSPPPLDAWAYATWVVQHSDRRRSDGL